MNSILFFIHNKQLKSNKDFKMNAAIESEYHTVYGKDLAGIINIHMYPVY